MMSSYYQRVQWLHDRPEDPAVLWAHVVDGWEVRKIDEFADGRLAWADVEHESTTPDWGPCRYQHLRRSGRTRSSWSSW